jgi:hypothetical protein
MNAINAMHPQTLQLIQILFQALSAMAIAGGLVYTAVQFSKSRASQHYANFTKLVELQMHLREMRVTDPALAEVYRHDVTGMQSQREVREYFFNLMQLSVFEIVWFGYKQGQVPSDYFRSWDTRMREIAMEASFRRMFFSPSMKIMHDEFQRYMTEVVKSVPVRDEPKP